MVNLFLAKLFVSKTVLKFMVLFYFNNRNHFQNGLLPKQPPKTSSTATRQARRCSKKFVLEASPRAELFLLDVVVSAETKKRQWHQNNRDMITSNEMSWKKSDCFYKEGSPVSECSSRQSWHRLRDVVTMQMPLRNRSVRRLRH